MSISRSQKTRLGIFCVIGALIACVMVAIPLGASVTKRTKIFFSYFSGESLSGLETGSTVKFHGVPIGKVSRITYDPRDLTRVKVEFKIQTDFPMKSDMYVQAGDMGITGLKYVEVLGGTNEAPLLKPGSELPSKVSMMASITGKAEVIVAKIELLLNNLNQITTPDSLASIKSVLGNLATITTDMRGFFSRVGPDIEGMSGSAQGLVGKLDSIASDVQVLTATFNDGFNGAQLRGILNSVDSTARSMKQMSENMSLLIKQSREDFSVSMKNLRETVESANDLMKVLAENPSLLLRGEQAKERGGR
jgi:phospholipid/cholesterol/gamma-HCH transport system substrate-binding protein